MDERRAAREVWLAARQAEHNPLGPERLRSVDAKLADPEATLVVVRRRGLVVGMGLAGAFVEDDTGAVRPDWCHVAMVFVHPDHQGVGVGREVVARLIAEHPAHTMSLWTEVSNQRAIDLYQHHGFVGTDEVTTLSDGRTIRRWQRPPGG